MTVGRRRYNNNVEPPLLRVDGWVAASTSSAFTCTSCCCLLSPCAVRRIAALKNTTGALLSRCVWVTVSNVRVVGLHDQLHYVGVVVLTRDEGERRSPAGRRPPLLKEHLQCVGCMRLVAYTLVLLLLLTLLLLRLPLLVRMPMRL